MSKYTPGPWFVDGVRFVRQEPAPRHVICRLPTTRNEGDARLIASAPALLEALQYAIRQVPELGTVPGISAAIAAATGHGESHE